MLCASSDLNSGKKVRVFHWGGGLMCLMCKLRSELRKESFIFEGRGGALCQIPEQGCSSKIWSKFSGSLAVWGITDSFSHTTYVETKI